MRSPRRWWPIALGSIAAAGLGQITGFWSNVSTWLGRADTAYHKRNATHALIQFTPKDPHGSRAARAADVGVYSATFENRSDDELIVTAVRFGSFQVAAAKSASSNGSAAGEAGGIEAAETYQIEHSCGTPLSHPLQPPFRIRSHGSGRFLVKVRVEGRKGHPEDCLVSVSFDTNQGETEETSFQLP